MRDPFLDTWQPPVDLLHHLVGYVLDGFIGGSCPQPVASQEGMVALPAQLD